MTPVTGQQPATTTLPPLSAPGAAANQPATNVDGHQQAAPQSPVSAEALPKEGSSHPVVVEDIDPETDPILAALATERETVPPSIPPGKTLISANSISGTYAVGLKAKGEAYIESDGTQLTADTVTYNELTDEAEAYGNVLIRQNRDWIRGPRAKLVIHESSGEFESPEYQISRMRPTLSIKDPDAPPEQISGGGHADMLYLEGENQYRFENATWTTCERPAPDWYIRGKDLALDYDRQVGVVRNGTLVFKDVPILWLPRMSFPLVGQRQSGFLVPSIGVSNKTGMDTSVPYYFNVAPNYDFTVAPRYMSRRGTQVAAESRYLFPYAQGTARVEWLNKDRQTGERRSLGSWQHQQLLAPRLSASWDVNAVSDKDYFNDLSTRLVVASQANLLREGRLNYNGDWWNLSGLMQSYQNLEGDSPYRRLPQILLTADRQDLPLGAAFSMRSEYVKFEHPDDNWAEGKRAMMYPSISLPFVRPAYYFTPKFGLHYTRYNLNNTAPGGKDSITRSLPIISLDSGLTFERDTSVLGNAFQQTLEPRLYYVHIPYRRQDYIPLFDTDRYDFDFPQIFQENTFAGYDRINNANHVTAAVTTRLIDTHGAERFRATVGQRYHFTKQRVTLNEYGKEPVESENDRSRTDWLAAIQGQLTRSFYLDSMVQYNPEDSRTERFRAGLRYHPENAKTLNISYRYSRDLLKDIDFSAQWPITRNLYGVTRMTRSLKDSRFTETLFGFEYAGGCGCWILRVAAHKFATTENDSTKAFFVQLELTGLGGIGPSPVNLIRRSVPGYGRLTDSISNRHFGE